MREPAREPRRLLMTTDCVGGVWTYSLELCAALGRCGVQVLLASMGGEPTRSQRDDAAALPNVEFHARPYRLEWMRDPWRDVEAAGAWLLELAGRFRPDLVQLNGYAHAALPWSAPVLVVGHSCVYSWFQAVHGTHPGPEWKAYHHAVQRGLRHADLVTAPTAAMLTELERHYGPFNTAEVIPNGRRRPPCNRHPSREPIIFAAGRLWDPAKNIETLAAAAPHLDWPVLVAGDTFEPQGHKAHFANVGCLGVLSASAVQRWMRHAEIYCLPARYEPFGLSILEAAQQGCALVLGDIPSLREVWGAAALYVPPNDADVLSATLQKLIADEPLRAELQARAQRHARRYTPALMACRTLALYRRLSHKVHSIHATRRSPQAVPQPLRVQL